ncbi:MAG: RluA family pseudouridine synthase [Planctomycetota bacterium]|nr:RluA family pseudouridine synthase [Planctomycetota bacterium]MDW8373107.1 RluA family pseudouridine synthase [Planctomycetota bacterium]
MWQELRVPREAAGQRLDVWLAAALGCTRSLVQRLLDDGRCAIYPGKARAGRSLTGGELVSIEVPEVEPASVEPEDIPLSVLHEDEHLLVVDKPAGMVVHPAIGHTRGTLVNALLWRWPDARSGGEAWRPGLVHRLDAETSGVICVARSAEALAFLQAAFAERRVRKQYLALCAGRPRADVLRCEAPIGRDPRDFRKRAVRRLGEGEAREAETLFLVRARGDGYSVVEARPRTGRTHQIRVHLAHLGHPVLADPLYGRSRTWPPGLADGAPGLRRHALHAWRLVVPHPRGGELVCTAPLPADLQPWVPAGLEPLA